MKKQNEEFKLKEKIEKAEQSIARYGAEITDLIAKRSKLYKSVQDFEVSHGKTKEVIA